MCVLSTISWTGGLTTKSIQYASSYPYYVAAPGGKWTTKIGSGKSYSARASVSYGGVNLRGDVTREGRSLSSRVIGRAESSTRPCDTSSPERICTDPRAVK